MDIYISVFWGKSQKEIISNRFNDWMGDGEQVDDILIMGIKF